MTCEFLPNEGRDPKIYIENLKRALNSNEWVRRHYFPNFVGMRKKQNEKLARETATGFADSFQWFEDYQPILDMIPLAYRKLIVYFSLKGWSDRPERAGVCINLKQFGIISRNAFDLELTKRNRALICGCSGIMLLENRVNTEYQGIETCVSDFRCYDCGALHQTAE